MGFEADDENGEQESLLARYAKWAVDELAGDPGSTQEGMSKVWNLITLAGVRKGLRYIVAAQEKKGDGE